MTRIVTGATKHRLPAVSKDALFLRLVKDAGLPAPEREHRFAPPRRWRFDFAWPSLDTALEVEGGVWTGGRHSRGAGMVKDMEKYNEAALAGWCVLRVTPKQLCSYQTIDLIRRGLAR